MRSVRILAAGIIIMGLSVVARADDAKAPAKAAPLRMSISTTLFEGTSEKLMAAMGVPFRGLLKLQTGIDGEIVPTGDGLKIADALADDKLQVAVMEGIEFAWARQKHPELRALMVAVNERPFSRSLLVVRDRSEVKRFEDLKGKTVTDFRFTRIFSRLYLDRRAREVAGSSSRKYFGKSVKADYAEDMLEEVLEGKSDAAIVEDVCLECFQRRKPERAKQLKVLEQSEPFPASAVVYKAGRLDAATLKRLHDGMLDAGSTVIGRQLMILWQMTGFENMPATYDTSLKELVKTYPAPGTVEVSERATSSAGKRNE
jgi:ABC-type phosphate/phosphonate transport system substrate-binding protein